MTTVTPQEARNRLGKLWEPCDLPGTDGVTPQRCPGRGMPPGQLPACMSGDSTRVEDLTPNTLRGHRKYSTGPRASQRGQRPGQKHKPAQAGALGSGASGGLGLAWVCQAQGGAPELRVDRGCVWACRAKELRVKRGLRGSARHREGHQSSGWAAAVCGPARHRSSGWMGVCVGQPGCPCAYRVSAEWV